MKRVLAAVLGAGLLLAGCGQSTTPAAIAAPGPYADGLDHSWTASAAEGQRIYGALSQGLKSQDFNIGLSITATNGYGPIELNTSNGESLAGDGHPITLNGKVYDTGLGVHADSEIHIHATNLETPACTRFQADVGIDDEVGDKGSAVFQVFADGVKLFDSGVMTGASVTQHIDVPIGNKSDLRFVVTNGGDNYYYDHADWAGATLSCAPVVPGAPTGSTDTTYTPNTVPNVQDTAMQPDGKLLAFGVVEAPDGSTAQDFFIRRFTPDGRLDQTFGTSGEVRLSFSIASIARRIVVQPDGKILAMGRASLPENPAPEIDTRGFLFIARFLPNGQLDQSFGNSNFADYKGVLFADDDLVKGLAVDADGKISTGGSFKIDTFGGSFIVHRYTSSGQPDLTFNGTGVVLIPLPSTYKPDLRDVTATPSGEIYALGSRFGGPSGNDKQWTIVRLNKVGQLDSSFGVGGFIFPENGRTSGAAQSLKVMPDGDLLIAGDVGDGAGFHCRADRLAATGAYKFSLAVPESLTNQNATFLAHDVSLAVQDDGKVILGGCSYFAPSGAAITYVQGLIRFSPDGTQDLGFGSKSTSGSFFLPVPNSLNPFIQPGTGGKIVVGLDSIVRINP